MNGLADWQARYYPYDYERRQHALYIRVDIDLHAEHAADAAFAPVWYWRSPIASRPYSYPRSTIGYGSQYGVRQIYVDRSAATKGIVGQRSVFVGNYRVLVCVIHAEFGGCCGLKKRPQADSSHLFHATTSTRAARRWVTRIPLRIACPLRDPMGRSAAGNHGHFRVAQHIGLPARLQLEPLRQPIF